MSEELSTRAQEICAHLLIFPYLARDKYRDLMLDDDLRAEVASRLDGVGMQLAESFYSDHFAVKPVAEIEADIRFDWATNKRIPRSAVALLVVLWAKLVLPRRIARDHRVNPDEDNLDLFPDKKPPSDFVVKVAKDAVLAEYSDRFGRSNLLRYIGQLKRLGFVKEDRAGRLFEGPLLDLLVDGQRLAEQINHGVLHEMLGRESEMAERAMAGVLDLVPENAIVDDDADPGDESIDGDHDEDTADEDTADEDTADEPDGADPKKAGPAVDSSSADASTPDETA
ncbi:MAG: hypothetical protein ACI9OJ_000280 [Myxococcota bacterium]|jgi:hypothetical protein